MEWLAGNRIIGTTAERPSGILQSPSVGGWKQVARTTLGSSGADITVSSIPDKRYYMVLSRTFNGSGTIHDQSYRLGTSGSIDPNSNYAYRLHKNGSESPQSTKSLIKLIDAQDEDFVVGYIANKSGKEKLTHSHGVSGYGNQVSASITAGKWTNTNVIDKLQIYNEASVHTYGGDSECVVLGWDPDDSHTDNFWQPLADVTLGTDGNVLSSGTITAKKYLWVQAFIKNNGDTSRFNTQVTFNNSTSGYNQRRTIDSGSSSAASGISQLFSSGVTGSNDDLWCINMFIVNESGKNKFCIAHGFDTYIGSGAGQAPSQKFEAVGEWTTTSGQITKIDITNSDTSKYDAISEIKVWGSD